MSGALSLESLKNEIPNQKGILVINSEGQMVDVFQESLFC